MKSNKELRKLTKKHKLRMKKPKAKRRPAKRDPFRGLGNFSTSIYSKFRKIDSFVWFMIVATTFIIGMGIGLSNKSYAGPYVFKLHMHLTNGEAIVLPVSSSSLDCMEVFNNEVDATMDRVQYKGVDVGAYYCKNGEGEWLQ